MLPAVRGRPESARSRPCRWRTLLTIAALAAAVLTGPARDCRAGAAPAVEVELRGVYVYNFIRFTEWPAGTFPTHASPLTLTVIGDPELGATLQRLLAGKMLDAHPVVVTVAEDPEACVNAQAVFVGAARQKDIREVLAAVGPHSILTISDVPSFVRQGGMIRIFRSEQRLRFEVNPRAAASSRLVISSRLLQLAENVVGR